MEKKRLTATEKDALVRMNVALEILANEPPLLDERAAMIPGAKRDIGMMKAKITKLMDAFSETIPTEQLKTYLNALVMADYVIGVRRPGLRGRDDREYGMWLPNEVIGALLEGCRDHCMMCPDQLDARKRCRLRKALDMCPSDVPQRDDGDCPYFMV
ncbi:MAG: hypothetical protein IKS52_04620 [Clostridia bacterium]|nr:hypothetical protein [Clostridia bacterium]